MADPIEFFDDTAQFYDAYYQQQGMEDASFYVDLATDADGPVLEAACGTGRIYLEMLEAGVDADGFDGSAGMLSVLRDRADERRLEPAVWQADMRTFEVDREYGLIVVPFRSFLHLTDISAQLDALSQFHRALEPGGELVMAYFAPDFDIICERYGEWVETTVPIDGVEYTVRDRTVIADDVAQIAEGTREVLGPEGGPVASASFELKLLQKREFELLLRESPFESWEVYGGFDLEPLESADQEMVWIVEP